MNSFPSQPDNNNFNANDRFTKAQNNSKIVNPFSTKNNNNNTASVHGFFAGMI